MDQKYVLWETCRSTWETAFPIIFRRSWGYQQEAHEQRDATPHL
jgi:hypothetical protein